MIDMSKRENRERAGTEQTPGDTIAHDPVKDLEVSRDMILTPGELLHQGQRLTFRTMDIERDADLLYRFRQDSFRVSYGTDEALGSKEGYLDWLREKSANFPRGFASVSDASGSVIGQIELQRREFDGKDSAYVNLFYLDEHSRHSGLGGELYEYVAQLALDWGVEQIYLKVSPSNTPAIRFYEKHGFQEFGRDDTVITMFKHL